MTVLASDFLDSYPANVANMVSS